MRRKRPRGVEAGGGVGKKEAGSPAADRGQAKLTGLDGAEPDVPRPAKVQPTDGATPRRGPEDEEVLRVMLRGRIPEYLAGGVYCARSWKRAVAEGRPFTKRKITYIQLGDFVGWLKHHHHDVTPLEIVYRGFLDLRCTPAVEPFEVMYKNHIYSKRYMVVPRHLTGIPRKVRPGRRGRIVTPTKVHDLLELRPLWEGSMTLRDAMGKFVTSLAHGTRCPLCARYAKLYERRLHKHMAVGLILIYKALQENLAAGGSEWLHVERILNGQRGVPMTVLREWQKLKFWGFVEPLQEERTDGNPRNGHWRLTESGKRFAEGKIKAPQFALVYRDQLFGMKEPEVTVFDVLKDTGFRYDELMRR